MKYKYATIISEQYISRPKQLADYRGRKAHAEIFLDCHPVLSYEGRAGMLAFTEEEYGPSLTASSWQL